MFWLKHLFPKYKYSASLAWAKLIVLPMIIMFSGCNSEDAPDCIKTTGRSETSFINTPPFNAISLNDGINLVLLQGEEKLLKVHAGKNVIPKIKFEVREGVLHITDENTCNWVRSYKEITVFATIDELTEISHNGYGEIRSAGKLFLNHFKIENYYGTGDIDLELEVNNLHIFTKSSATIKIKGKATGLQLEYIYNPGTFLGEELMAENISIFHLGQSDLKVYPIKSLSATIGHTGNVEIYNEPESIWEELSSFGRLIFKY